MYDQVGFHQAYLVLDLITLSFTLISAFLLTVRHKALTAPATQSGKIV
ncbi:galactoside permease [Sodalis glossinidius str. 'morsitans']|uniref:Galactoside permease n=1 Tax=Sodalis glossinidius (strain morsitans) TaxID=343509 RepID=A0A193QLG1_SODGM|nr:galactoside permease [Sodalis glossinidius str. 'morsitans']